MARDARRSLSLAALAATTLLAGCATTFNSAGDRYYSFWPFIGSRNPELQLNYPAQNPRTLQLGPQSDPFYLISPQPPVDPLVTSPYALAPKDPEARVATLGDNAACADRCESKETGAEVSAPLALRTNAGNDRLIASR